MLHELSTWASVVASPGRSLRNSEAGGCLSSPDAGLRCCQSWAHHQDTGRAEGLQLPQPSDAPSAPSAQDSPLLHLQNPGHTASFSFMVPDDRAFWAVGVLIPTWLTHRANIFPEATESRNILSDKLRHSLTKDDWIHGQQGAVHLIGAKVHPFFLSLTYSLRSWAPPKMDEKDSGHRIWRIFICPLSAACKLHFGSWESVIDLDYENITQHSHNKDYAVQLHNKIQLYGMVIFYLSSPTL